MPPESFPRSIFAGRLTGAHEDAPSAPGAIQSRISMRLLSERVQRIVEAYRELGHLSADLDPLGLVTRPSPTIALEDYGLAEQDLDLVFSSENVAGPRRKTLRDLVSLLRETYCRTVGVQTSHIHDLELRDWLQTRMESTRNRLPLTRADRIQVFQQVIGAEVFEQFLQNKFLGSKRFSLEGAESLIPLLERLVERAARSSVSEIVIGMAHRGRLNVLANVLKKPPSQIFAEFQDKLDEKVDLNDGGGDVKYHLGFSIDRVFGEGPDEHKVHLSLAFNPSHLEWVNTVVQGRVRAKQDRLGDAGRTRALPILIHGDAAFAGQGIIAEALNMSELEGYSVGGTVHIVVNNQVGFTTSPQSRQVDHLRHRRGDDAADPDLPRQRRGSRGGLPGGRSGGRLPSAVPPRRADRAVVLPQARTQRRRRAFVHAAGDVSDHRLEAVDPDGLPGLRRGPPGARWRAPHHRRGDGRHRRRQAARAGIRAGGGEQAGDAAAPEHVRRRLGPGQGWPRQQGPRGAHVGDAGGGQGGHPRAHHHAARTFTFTPSCRS